MKLVPPGSVANLSLARSTGVMAKLSFRNKTLVLTAKLSFSQRNCSSRQRFLFHCKTFSLKAELPPLGKLSVSPRRNCLKNRARAFEHIIRLILKSKVLCKFTLTQWMADDLSVRMFFRRLECSRLFCHLEALF